MNEDIYKAIVTSTILTNRFLQEATPMNKVAYKKQSNYCVFLCFMCEIEKQYYSPLNVNRVTDNKNFWRVVKPTFSNKTVTLKEEEVVRRKHTESHDNLRDF